MKRRLKSTGFDVSGIQKAVSRLRSQGFQPHFHRGELKDWRRVRDHRLEIATVNVRDSGRVTVHVQRSSNDGDPTQS